MAIAHAIITSIHEGRTVEVGVSSIDEVAALHGHEDSVEIAPGRFDVWGSDDDGDEWRLLVVEADA